MFSKALVRVDADIFEDIVCEMKYTRAQLELCLNKSEKVLIKFCKLKLKGSKNCKLKIIKNDK